MSVAMEATVSLTPLPVPTHFSYAEQSFSLKKRRLPFSSSSTPYLPSPACLSCSQPPRPPSKGCAALSRVFTQRPSPWTPLSTSLNKTPPVASLYNPSKQESYFTQCFTNLGLLGKGCFGEVYKVVSHLDGRHYAVKRSAHRFRGSRERKCSLREARNHERLPPHPHILGFVGAWEEGGRVYIQMELCVTNLLLHAENQLPSPDEGAVWTYLCDLLLALQHLHSQNFVHLDVKPANVFLTHSGRLKLGDFGLLFELPQQGAESGKEKEKEEVQEGDPRYMAPELLRGECGHPADVFSLGVSILELACTMEVPKGGEGWQQLRKGYLPAEFTCALSAELQAILKMMLAPDPSQRATVTELLSLPSVRGHMWRRRLYLLLIEAMLKLVSLYQSVVDFGWQLLSSIHLPFFPHYTAPMPCTPPKDSWERDFTVPLSAMHTDPDSSGDDAVFPLDLTDTELSPSFSHRVGSRLSVGSTSTPLPASQMHTHPSPPNTPSHLGLGGSPSRSPAPSPIHSHRSWHNLSPTQSLIHSEPENPAPTSCSTRTRRSSSKDSIKRRTCFWVKDEESVPLPGFEPRNLLGLFEEIESEGQP
ncbi:membrane-associated tyrosine- and threonine-specific cdc2-inhibitory kinase isoform X2 [Lampris incognitus]|nr:membrane-associated tyrosine- and threonine-specific cdc2-inhibitory kinase isoform X2 [Lampris incognitus]